VANRDLPPGHRPAPRGLRPRPAAGLPFQKALGGPLGGGDSQPSNATGETRARQDTVILPTTSPDSGLPCWRFRRTIGNAGMVPPSFDSGVDETKRLACVGSSRGRQVGGWHHPWSGAAGSVGRHNRPREERATCVSCDDPLRPDGTLRGVDRAPTRIGGGIGSAQGPWGRSVLSRG
jgi:hypothetical protein